MYETVLLKKDGGVTTVALNRPKVLNAFNMQLHEEIYDTLNEAAADDEVWCVVLRGEGKGFSSGADLTEVVKGEGDSDGPDLGEYLRNTYSRLITQMVGIEKPIVAALHGPVYGAGLGLALASDLRLAAESAKFPVAFVIDADGDMFITPDVIIPLPEAKDYIERKEDERKEVAKRSGVSSFALDRGTFDQKELEQRLRATLVRSTILTPRFVRFLEILLSEHRKFGRDEVQQKLFEKGVGTNLGQTGRYLSGLSQLLTKRSNPHLRQIITFASDGYQGAQKDQYRVVTEHRELVRWLVDEYNNKSSEAESLSTTDGYSGTAGTAESGS